MFFLFSIKPKINWELNQYLKLIYDLTSFQTSWPCLWVSWILIKCIVFLNISVLLFETHVGVLPTHKALHPSSLRHWPVDLWAEDLNKCHGYFPAWVTSLTVMRCHGHWCDRYYSSEGCWEAVKKKKWIPPNTNCEPVVSADNRTREEDMLAQGQMM